MEAALIFGMMVLYKIVGLIVGLALCHMGFRLFMMDKTHEKADMTAAGKGYKVTLTGAGPGIFFALFGTAVICFTILKGMSYSEGTPISRTSTSHIEIVLPETPPF